MSMDKIRAELLAEMTSKHQWPEDRANRCLDRAFGAYEAAKTALRGLLVPNPNEAGDFKEQQAFAQANVLTIQLLANWAEEALPKVQAMADAVFEPDGVLGTLKLFGLASLLGVDVESVLLQDEAKRAMARHAEQAPSQGN